MDAPRLLPASHGRKGKPLFIEHQFGGSVRRTHRQEPRLVAPPRTQRSHISQGSTASGVVPLTQERAPVSFATPDLSTP